MVDLGQSGTDLEIQKVPILGNYFIKEVHPADNVRILFFGGLFYEGGEIMCGGRGFGIEAFMLWMRCCIYGLSAASAN